MNRVVCTQCASISNPSRPKTGNLLLEIIHWIVHPFAGALYSIGRAMAPESGCLVCGAENAQVPLDTPAGRRMLLKHCESEDALPEDRERIFARFGVTA